MFKQKKYLVAIAALIVFAIVLFGIARRETDVESISKIKVGYCEIRSVISTTGTVAPQNRLEIKPPIGGRLDRILVHEGDHVKVGQILAWMSSTDRAALIDAARSQGEKAVKYWEEVYKPTPLIAPIDGDVIVRAMEPGQTVTESTPVLVLSDRLIVVAQVDETDIGRVKVGQKAIVSLDAYPDVKVESMVDHIDYESKVVNNVTIYEVDILPEKVPEVFRSGMSAVVEIVENDKPRVLCLPLDAVRRTRKGAVVLLEEKGGSMPVERKVELGISDDNNVEIVSGLAEGDTVVIKSARKKSSKSVPAGRNPFLPFRGRR